jgi:uncharacterized protein (TIGR00725 family)
LRQPVLAVVGPGDGATEQDLRHAESLGALAARQGWLVINGGVASGVMEAASRGASDAGGTVVGILPSADTSEANPFLTVAVVTAMGQARNNIIVLSSDAVAVCGMSPGTAVEAALALRARRPVVFVAAESAVKAFYERLGGARRTQFTDSPEQAIALLRPLLDRQS